MARVNEMLQGRSISPYRHIEIMAERDKQSGLSEIDFVNQFASELQDVAREAYENAEVSK